MVLTKCMLLLKKELKKSRLPGRQTDLIVTNFAKAFDKVAERRLFDKFDFYFVRGNTCRLVNSFLSNTTRRVVLDWEI